MIASLNKDTWRDIILEKIKLVQGVVTHGAVGKGEDGVSLKGYTVNLLKSSKG